MIRTADADLDALRESIEGSAARSGFEGKLVFLTDERIASGDLRIEWADGGAERDQAALWAEIDGVIARALRPAKNAPAPAGPPKEAPATSGKTSTGPKPAPSSTEPHSQPRKSAEIEPLRRAQTA
jgi:flagellar assembly protein FliH